MGNGIIGIAFRMSGTDNGYILQCHRKMGEKRLLRVENGIVKTIARREDGGFVEGVWYTLKLRVSGANIKVCLGEAHEPTSEIFS